jgi:hypothetical protein
MEEHRCGCGTKCQYHAKMPAPPEPWAPPPRKVAPPEVLNGYQLEQYGNSRFWQVTDPAGELICVTVYKRGGREVMKRLAA